MAISAISLDDRKKFYDTLKANMWGDRDTLKEQVAFKDDPHDSKFFELYKELGSVGIIRMGIDGRFIPRYRVTKFGEEQIDSFTMLCNL